MKHYRCKHTVEGMRWTDTDEDREILADWFESHDAMFETRGPIVVLPSGDHNHAAPGDWIIWADDEFAVMDDEIFVHTYALVAATDEGQLSDLEKYLLDEADYNRSWADGRRGGDRDFSDVYKARRIELAEQRERWAAQLRALRGGR